MCLCADREPIAGCPVNPYAASTYRSTSEASQPFSTPHDSNQRCRPNLADPTEKNSRGHERFFFETFRRLFAH